MNPVRVRYWCSNGCGKTVKYKPWLREGIRRLSCSKCNKLYTKEEVKKEEINNGGK